VKQLSGPTATGMVGTSVTLTQSAISFSKKQQISKSEYLRTQQTTFTHGMGKSDLMHKVCGAHGIFQKKSIFDAWLFLKHFIIFKAHPLPSDHEVFQNRTISPGLNHPGISVISHRFSFSKTAIGLPVHHSSRFNNGAFKTIFQNIFGKQNTNFQIHAITHPYP
jgi:hypothetical protein